MRTMLLRFLYVGLAGFVGAIARVAVVILFGRLNIRFPLSTLFVNITGSLFLGWFLTHFATRGLSDTMRLSIGSGFVGAYTTFSTFMYESNALADEGAGFQALANLIGSLVLGILAVRLGMLIARYV